jgi:hypothetical protein
MEVRGQTELRISAYQVLLDATAPVHPDCLAPMPLYVARSPHRPDRDCPPPSSWGSRPTLLQAADRIAGRAPTQHRQCLQVGRRRRPWLLAGGAAPALVGAGHQQRQRPPPAVSGQVQLGPRLVPVDRVCAYWSSPHRPQARGVHAHPRPIQLVGLAELVQQQLLQSGADQIAPPRMAGRMVAWSASAAKGRLSAWARAYGACRTASGPNAGLLAD